MSDEDLIRRGDARRILEEERFLERSLANLNDLPAVQVAVTPLEFVYGKAESIIGNYLIDSGWKDKVGGDRWWAWAGPTVTDNDRDPFYVWQHGALVADEEAAKAAAQADYEARIRSALTAQPSPDVVEIDLRAVMMEEIEDAAAQSPWVPPEYTMNEVVSDCCAFLREPRSQSPDVAALVEAKLQAADTYANEVTPNGGRRIDNITGLLSDRQARHITTQIDLAFKAGWQAALARVKGGAA